jgi:signal transduction histidine kinase
MGVALLVTAVGLGTWRYRSVLGLNRLLSASILERGQAQEALERHSDRLEEMVDERTKELKEAQEQLVRRKALAVMGQMAGSVGHELRNPLGVISNAVYYLQMVLADADETTQQYLEMISSETRNSTRIVSDLLDLSRTRPAEREEVAVSTLVAGVLAQNLPPAGVEVVDEIGGDVTPVYVDPRQIGQVVTNLIANAYDAMPEGGRMIIGARPQQGHIALSITDTGRGIPPENMERIFEPLFTTKPRGIGLGLVISRNLAEANRGSIQVESQVGEGTTFTLVLPTREALS